MSGTARAPTAPQRMTLKRLQAGDRDADATTQLLRDWGSILPDIDEGAFSIQVRIAEIDRFAIRYTDKIAAALSIDHVDVRLLMAVKRAQQRKPIRPTDLCKIFGIAPSAITRQLDRLVKLGLIRRKPDPTDRRALYVELTAKGEKATARIVTEFHSATRRRMRAIDMIPGGIETLDRLLGIVMREWAALDEVDDATTD